MKKLRLSYAIVICACMLQLFSCQKQLEKQADDSLEYNTMNNAALVSEIADCKLRTVTHAVDSGDNPESQIVGTFVYHPDGLPAQLTYNPGNSGNLNYYFLYDSKRRLKELRYGVNQTTSLFGIWHRYGYNNIDQIIVDSSYNNNGSGNVLSRISALTYDGQGRVVKEIETSYSEGNVFSTKTIIYAYDAKGNLIVEGWPSSSYDGNKSIFRAHPLFQFIHRNYSKNNAAPQAKYNVKGFPLSNNPTNAAFFNAQPTNTFGYGVRKATYDCDGFVPANEFLYCKMRYFIQEINNFDGTIIENKGTFIYHPDGLPESLIYSGFGIMSQNFFFVYDKQRRLRELQVGYRRNEGGDVGPWHRYGYNNFNQIIVDTFLNFSGFEPSSAYVRAIPTFTYDNLGRIRTEVSTGYSGGMPGSPRTVNYDYDSRGNLIVPGWSSSSYDNKVSIFRAHSLFQFIHRNYSKNNAVAEPRYNSKGLPLSANLNDEFFETYPSTARTADILKINYDCR